MCVGSFAQRLKDPKGRRKRQLLTHHTSTTITTTTHSLTCSGMNFALSTPMHPSGRNLPAHQAHSPSSAPFFTHSRLSLISMQVAAVFFFFLLLLSADTLFVNINDGSSSSSEAPLMLQKKCGFGNLPVAGRNGFLHAVHARCIMHSHQHSSHQQPAQRSESCLHLNPHPLPPTTCATGMPDVHPR